MHTDDECDVGWGPNWQLVIHLLRVPLVVVPSAGVRCSDEAHLSVMLIGVRDPLVCLYTDIESVKLSLITQSNSPISILLSDLSLRPGIAASGRPASRARQNYNSSNSLAMHMPQRVFARSGLILVLD